MPGSLPNLTALPPMTPDEGMSRLNVTDAALAEVLKTLRPPSRPEWDGKMPRSLVSLDDDTLGDLLSKAGEWASFVEFELAKADTQREASKEQLNFIRASIRLSLRANDLAGEQRKRLTVSDKDDLMNNDPRVIEAQSRAIYTESLYKLIRVLATEAQRNWDTISRRITQRGQQVERIKRESTIGSIPAAPMRTYHRPA